MRYAFACLTIALLVLVVGNANAQGDIYVGGFGGYAMDLFDQDDVWNGLTADPDEVNGSWLIGVLLGYNVSPEMAIEGSFAYNFKFQPDEEALDANELTVWTFMGSLKYRFATDAEWVPFVSGGVGWAKFETDPATFMIPDQDGALDTEQTGLLVRVAGGIEYALNDGVLIIADVGYNFTFGDIEDWNFVDVRVGVGTSF